MGLQGNVKVNLHVYTLVTLGGIVLFELIYKLYQKMIIQFNTDHHINGSEKLFATLSDTITAALSHYSSHLTRVEVHLTDENGSKTGQNDKKCVLETRVEGRQPTVVTNHAGSIDNAVDGAIEKLKHALGSVIGKMNDH